MKVRALAVWLLLMAAEVVHGTLRTILLAPIVGDFRARQLAVFSGSLIVLLIATLTIGWMRIDRSPALWTVGLAWVVLTIGFEVLLGHFAFGFSWERLGSDYNVARGGLLPIGLAVMAASPTIAKRLRGPL